MLLFIYIIIHFVASTCLLVLGNYVLIYLKAILGSFECTDDMSLALILQSLVSQLNIFQVFNVAETYIDSHFHSVVPSVRTVKLNLIRFLTTCV